MFDTAVAAAQQAIQTANARIFGEAKARGIQMGTTLVALLVRDARFALFWVGDSRCYRWRDGGIERLTRDHTEVQRLVDRGLLDPAQAENHPMSYVLARAIGAMDPVTIDVVTGVVEPGDRFLLCSDGLTGRVGDDELAGLLQPASHLGAVVDRLVATTLARGAPDNVTAVLVAADETGFAQEAAT